jgi:phosphatidylserine decarboxylase
MYLHKEGYRLIAWFSAISVGIIVLMCLTVRQWEIIHYLLLATVVFVWAFFIAFFRIPKRTFTQDKGKLIAPADGTVCVIEEVFEKEYLNCQCLMVSIFMHGYNVHVNRYPADGTVEYVNYQKGNYFNASFPKSSEMNERAGIGFVTSGGNKILMRQVAGVMARRICCYARKGEQVKQNQEFGFIKFGSRVDLFLPVGTPLHVKLNDNVKNGIDIIATLN